MTFIKLFTFLGALVLSWQWYGFEKATPWYFNILNFLTMFEHNLTERSLSFHKAIRQRAFILITEGTALKYTVVYKQTVNSIHTVLE